MPRKAKPKPLPIASTSELQADAANPRTISDEGLAGLGQSIEKFGDLSGIVFNQRTGALVTGHQRVDQIRAQYGDREIVTVDAERELGGIAIDEERFFPVRIVDWSAAKQRAANVAANNPKLQGTFTDELSSYLLEFSDELREEVPGVLNDCLMMELMQDEVISPVELRAVEVQPPPDTTWVLIRCDTVHYGLIGNAVEKIADVPGVQVEMTSNNG